MMQFVQRPPRTDHAVEVETPLAIEIELIRHVELEAVRAHHRAGDAPFAAEEAARLDLKLFARGTGATQHRGAAGRSAERRVGRECESKCRPRWSQIA